MSENARTLVPAIIGFMRKRYALAYREGRIVRIVGSRRTIIAQEDEDRQSLASHPRQLLTFKNYKFT